jgi:hypothetical protein
MKKILLIILVLVSLDVKSQAKKAETILAKDTFNVDLFDFFNSIQNAVDLTANQGSGIRYKTKLNRIRNGS